MTAPDRRFFRPIRWSDRDRYFGPFTFCRRDGWDFGAVLSSGDGDEYAGCRLRMHLMGYTLIVALPPIIKPWRVKKKFAHLSPDELARVGRDFYYETGDRDFGFAASEGALHIYYGNRVNEWPGCKSKVIFYPWRAWRRDSTTFYDNAMRPVALARTWDEVWAAKDACPSVTFAFDDYDGERITAICKVEETRQLWGEGRFKWLSWLRPARVWRHLDIQFSAEVGPRKGSWKGGTVGHGIDMQPGEDHEAAFRRYCAKEGLTYQGPAALRAIGEVRE